MKKLFFTILIFVLLLNYIIIFIPNKAYAAYNQVTINANSNNNNGIDAFPQSYQIMLKKLVNDTGHTNWKFKAFYTDIDWNELTSSANENKCLRNTIYKSNGQWICSCGRQGDVGYYCASAKIVNYYLDPRNFLTETTIFQFLDLSNETKVSVADIQKAVQGTYLAGSVDGVSYAQMIYDAAEASGENALSIVVKIFQELGRGTSLPGMITGKNSTYPNTYNFFNYGASDGAGNILRGLAYAHNAGWDTPRKALIEGAKLISNSYIKAGQNTKYTFKFDVVSDNSTGLYWHQYMTNIQDPTNQAKMLFDEYINNNWLNNELTFVIPVYKNMPAYVKLPSSLTTGDGTLYFISSNYSDVALRAKATANSGSLDSLKRNTPVLMLNYNENNSGWSKVRVNGQEGYVINTYLTPVNTVVDTYNVPNQPSDTKPKEEEPSNPPSEITPTPPSTQEKPEDNNNFKIEGTNIMAETGTKLSDIKNKYTVTSAKKDGKEISNDTNLATGTDITISEKTYTLVKMGDINGDGYVDTGDTLVAKQVVLDMKHVEGCYELAMDVNKDGYTDTGDTLALKKCILGVTKLQI